RKMRPNLVNCKSHYRRSTNHAARIEVCVLIAIANSREEKVRSHSIIKLTILVVSLFLTAPSMSAQGGGQRGEGQRGGRGEGAQAALANIPIPRMPDGTPNLSWDDPAKKGYWRSGMHWEYGKDQ